MNYTDGVLKYLIRCKPGCGRAKMPPWTANPREPDYTGYMLDVSGEPRAVALWVGRDGCRANEQGISIKLRRCKLDGGHLKAMDDGDEAGWVVGVDEEKGWVEHE